jgi:hypothetical protein
MIDLSKHGKSRKCGPEQANRKLGQFLRLAYGTREIPPGDNVAIRGKLGLHAANTLLRKSVNDKIGKVSDSMREQFKRPWFQGDCVHRLVGHYEYAARVVQEWRRSEHDRGRRSGGSQLQSPNKYQHAACPYCGRRHLAVCQSIK